MIYYFSKQLRRVLQGLYVDQNSLGRVKDLVAEGKHVVLMPFFKSFADSFIHIYLNNYFNLEVPFIFGN